MVNKIALVVSYVVIITLGATMTKIAYQMSVVGKPEFPAHEFRKPFFMESIMFTGMVMSYPVFWILQCCSKPKMASDPLLAKAAQAPKGESWKVYALIFVPAMFDLIASGMSFTGLLYIDNSTGQMLGSTIIIFSGLLSCAILGRRYNRVQLSGMAIVMIAIVVIAAAANVAAHDAAAARSGTGAEATTSAVAASPQTQVFGMLLCIGARFINACQFVCEEKLMTDVSLDPLQIVGTEGIYGLLVTTCVLLPIFARIPGHDVGGVFEDSVDSLMMLRSNGWLCLVCFLYLLGLWGLNALGMMVVKHLGVVFRAVTSNMKSLFVWLIDLYLFYHVGDSWGFPVGEMWEGRGSWLKICGFVLLLSGALTYAYGCSLAQVAKLMKEGAKDPDTSNSVLLMAEKQSQSPGAIGAPSLWDVVQAETAALMSGPRTETLGLRALVSPQKEMWTNSKWFGSPAAGRGDGANIQLYCSPTCQARGGSGDSTIAVVGM